MPVQAEVYGVDVDGIFSDALLQPVGQQKTYFSEQFAAAFPSPELDAEAGNVQKYLADFSAAFSGSSTGVSVGDLAAPTVNVAEDFSAAEGLITIRSKTFPSRRIVVPVGATSADGTRLVISPGLDGTKILRAALGIMLPPPGLDVATGGYSVQTLIDDMLLPNDANPAAALDFDDWGTRLWSGYTSAEGTNATHLSAWYEFVPVMDAGAMPYPAAPNSRLEIRNFRFFVYRNGSWLQLMLADTSSEIWGSDWFHKQGYDINGYPTVVVNQVGITGGIAHPLDRFRSDPYWVQHGYPADSQFRVPLKFSDQERICVQLEARIALINPNGADDRANVPLLGHVAADWHTSSAQVGVSHQARFKRVTNDWVPFTAINMTTDKRPIGGQLYPGVCTAQDILDNPPPMAF